MSFFLDIISYSFFVFGSALLFLGTVVNKVPADQHIYLIYIVAFFYGAFALFGLIGQALGKYEKKTGPRNNKLLFYGGLFGSIAIGTVLGIILKSNGWEIQNALILGVIVVIGLAFLSYRLKQKL
jgi:hypothetical protein